jgi:hypothetical protein
LALSLKFSSFDQAIEQDLTEARVRRNLLLDLSKAPWVSETPTFVRVHETLLYNLAGRFVARSSEQSTGRRAQFDAALVVDIDEHCSHFSCCLANLIGTLEGKARSQTEQVFERDVFELGAWTLASALRILPFSFDTLQFSEFASNWVLLRYGFFAWVPPFGPRTAERLNLLDAYDEALYEALSINYEMCETAFEESCQDLTQYLQLADELRPRFLPGERRSSSP